MKHVSADGFIVVCNIPEIKIGTFPWVLESSSFLHVDAFWVIEKVEWNRMRHVPQAFILRREAIWLKIMYFSNLTLLHLLQSNSSQLGRSCRMFWNTGENKEFFNKKWILHVSFQVELPWSDP